MAHFILHYDSIIITALAKREARRNFFIFFSALSHFGDGIFYVLIGLLEFVFFGAEGRFMFLAILIGYTVQIPAYLLIKKTVKRLRPFDKLENIQNMIAAPDKYSFPSGHTAAAFLMAGSLSFQFPELQVVMYSVAGLIGFSRVYLRVHYPTDVLAGALLGYLSSWFGLWIIF